MIELYSERERAVLRDAARLLGCPLSSLSIVRKGSGKGYPATVVYSEPKKGKPSSEFTRIKQAFEKIKQAG